MKKIKMRALSKKYVTSQNVKIFILFIPLLILFIKQCRDGEATLATFLDTGVLVSFILVFICDLVASLISHIVGKRYEDCTKLTTDYDMLVKKYCREKFIEYQGSIFPVICQVFRRKEEIKFDIRFCYFDQKYELPKQIADNSSYIMEAHSFSKVYNNMNIRINDICTDENKVTISYSMTTYFDSLITNRAMDFPLENNKSIREIYEPGPFLSTLSESRLSNHIGFNGFIELADRKVILVVRNGDVSIGKHTLAGSIGASLKTKYCLNEDRRLTNAGISNAIRREIYDELRIEIDESIDLCDTVFAFYRDIVEGGKPQFLFYYKSDVVTSEQFDKKFFSEVKKHGIGKNDVVQDGTHFEYLTITELRECTITPGQIVFPNMKVYTMMPSVAASIVMFLQYMS